MRTSYDDCDFDDDPGRLDRDALWHLLAGTAYWAKNRTRLMFDRQLASAWRVVGVYSADSGYLERPTRLPVIRP